LSRPVDVVENIWIKFVFLNIPLQMVMTFTAILFLNGKNRRSKIIGANLLCFVFLLILVSITISVAQFL